MFGTEKKQLVSGQILEYLNNKNGPAKLNELSKHLEISSNDKDYESLKGLLVELELNGVIEKLTRRRYQINGTDTGTMKGKLVWGSKKSYVISEKDEDAKVNIRRKHCENALHGDIVEINVIPDKRGKLWGRVIDIIQRNEEELKGIVEEDVDGHYFVPDSGNYPYDFFVTDDHLEGAKHGDIAFAKILEWNDPLKNPYATITRVVGSNYDNQIKYNSIVEEFLLPTEFPEAVEKESNSAARPKYIKGKTKRTDLRKETVITIDPDDAKDFDDALSLKLLDNGNYELGVHIADVSHYVTEDSELDLEARVRGNSTYLADRVIPMLPERLSNDICSLRPNEDRFCFSVFIELGPRCGFLNYRIEETIINSKRRFTYDEVLKIIQTGDGDHSYLIKDLHRISRTLRSNRFIHGGINFETSEVRFKFDEENNPVDVKLKQGNDATQLVEECMLAANRVVANHFKEISKKYKIGSILPSLYRIHENPDSKLIKEAVEFINSLGNKFNTRNVTSKQLNQIIDHYHGKPEQNLVNTVLIRSLPKAYYAGKNHGHFGLGFADYTHFTSPIRRYCDLIVHRLIKEYAKAKPDNQRINYLRVFVGSVSKHISETEKKSMDAERASVKLTQTILMSPKIGQEFNATVSGIVSYGVFVMVDDLFAEGLVRIRDVKGDYFFFDEKRYRFVGKRSNKELRIGSRVRVSLEKVNMEKRLIDFGFINILDTKKTEK